MFHLNDQQPNCKTTPHVCQPTARYLAQIRETRSGPIDFAYRPTFLRQLEIGVSVPAWCGFSGPHSPFERLSRSTGNSARPCCRDSPAASWWS